MADRSLIFDLDGVVVDSNRMHVDSWKAVADRHAHPCPDPEHIGKCGLRTTAVIRDLLRWPVSEADAERLGAEKEELYRQWIRDGGIPAIPGIRGFLEKARRLEMPCAVGSSAPRANLDLCLQALDLAAFFQATVSGEDVTRGKPAPDIFLLAARRLGAAPHDCVVFEDSPAGIAAAHAAGMTAVALRTSHEEWEIAAADAVVNDFTGLAPNHLPLGNSR